MLQEELGYLDGGSQVLIDAWEAHINRLGGVIKCSTPVEKLTIAEPIDHTFSSNKQLTGSSNKQLTGDRQRKVVTGLIANGQSYEFDQVISTIPLPMTAKIALELSAAEKKMIADIKYIGVRCILVKLKKRLLPYFWTNISDPAIPIPGVIEYTNLRQLSDHIVYAPFYLPHNHELYQAPDKELIDHTLNTFGMLNKDFRRSWVIDIVATRYHLAQPVCPPNFFNSIPPIHTSIWGFYMADTSYYYPEDRSISESIALGEILAKTALSDAIPEVARQTINKSAQGA
jgi:protoporphyrinogen oxidase